MANLSGDCRLRRFERADLAAVKRLVYGTIDGSYTGAYPQEAIVFFKEYHSEEHILQDATDGYTIVLELDGRLVGTGTLLGTNVRRVFVDPALQHAGFGKWIMRELEQRAAADGIRTLDLSASLVSKRFYDALAYRTEKEGCIPVANGQKLVYYAMSKTLDDGGG